MTPATSTRNTTKDIIDALIMAIKLIKLSDNVTPAFGRVEYFDVEKLAEAAKFLLITEQRVCVIVPLEEQLEQAVKGQNIILTRTLPICLMISDRVLGDRQRKDALLGNDNTPGAQGLVDLTLPAVFGMLIQPNAGPPAVSGIKCIPTDISQINVVQKDLPGRVAMGIVLECTGGIYTANTGPGNIL